MEEVYYLDLETVLTHTSNGSNLMKLGYFSSRNYENRNEFTESLLKVNPNSCIRIKLSGGDYLSLSLLIGETLLKWQNSKSPYSGSPFSSFRYYRFHGNEGFLYLANTSSSYSLLHLVHNGRLNWSLIDRIGEMNYELSGKESLSLVRESLNLWRLDSLENKINSSDLDRFFTESESNGIDRSRICCHQTDKSILQEMFIVMTPHTYLPKMMHLDKDESFLLLEGNMTYSFYTQEGDLLDQIEMVGLHTMVESLNQCFFIRIGRGVFHKPEVTSQRIFAKETTTGPFCPEFTKTQL